MKPPELQPVNRVLLNDAFEPVPDDLSIDRLLYRYQTDPLAMQSLRLTLVATNTLVQNRSDHEVVALVRHKIKQGAIRIKQDPCDRMNGRNRTYRDWIDAHRVDAAKVATSLQINPEQILGLSALESAWGLSRFAKEGNNFFGLHGNAKSPLPGQEGLIPAKGDPTVGMAKFSSYLASAQSFAQTKGKLVVGVTDPTRFASILQTQGKFGIGPQGPVKDYVSNVANTIKGMADRLQCK